MHHHHRSDVPPRRSSPSLPHIEFIFLSFFCFLWQNNTLGIHIRWFIDVTWLCCSYFTFSKLSNLVYRIWCFLHSPASCSQPETSRRTNPDGKRRFFVVYLIFGSGTNKFPLHHSNKPIHSSSQYLILNCFFHSFFCLSPRWFTALSSTNSENRKVTTPKDVA